MKLCSKALGKQCKFKTMMLPVSAQRGPPRQAWLTFDSAGPVGMVGALAKALCRESALWTRLEQDANAKPRQTSIAYQKTRRRTPCVPAS